MLLVALGYPTSPPEPQDIASLLVCNLAASSVADLWTSHPFNMAALNPDAPVYIPSPHLRCLEGYYSPLPLPLPLPQHPPLTPFYFQCNQNNVFFISSPTPFTQDFCYYVPPTTPYDCCYRKEFTYLHIPPPCPSGPLLRPPCGLDQPRAALTIMSEENKERSHDCVTSETPVKHGKKEGVGERKGYKGVKGSKGLRGFRSGSSGGKRVYVTKPARCHGGLPPLLRRRKLSGDYEFRKVEHGVGDPIADSKTTVMIKNLPNKFTMEKLLAILDKHCLQENEKFLSLKREEASDVAKLGDADAVTTLSEFDFLYLPIDFRSGSNLGYAFVNFTSPSAAWRLHDYLHRFEWKCFGSRKRCEVTYARIQGLQDLKDHFKNSTFLCERDQFLPMSFHPSRNGFNQPEPEFVGTRIHAASQVMA